MMSQDWGKVPNGLSRQDQRHAIGLELTYRGVRAGHSAAAHPDPEIEPAFGDDVDRRRHLRQQGGGAKPIAGHDDTEPQPVRLGQGGEQISPARPWDPSGSAGGSALSSSQSTIVLRSRSRKLHAAWESTGPPWSR
jgi:hypothetical protein